MTKDAENLERIANYEQNAPDHLVYIALSMGHEILKVGCGLIGQKRVFAQWLWCLQETTGITVVVCAKNQEGTSYYYTVEDFLAPFVGSFLIRRTF